MTLDYHAMVASALRALAGAPPENILAVVSLQAREIIGTCAKNDWPAGDAIDALSEAAIARNLDPDEVQAALAEAATPRTNGKANRSAEGGAPGGAAVNIRTAATLRTKTFEPIHYIVPGYIAEGCTILAGRPKLGKSWLMLDIGLAVARGGYCLGNIKCEQGDVLGLWLEDNERRLQQRITKLLGYREEWPGSFHYETEWPRANAGGLEAIRKWVASVGKPRLVVLDVLAMIRVPRTDKQSQYEADYAAVQALQKIASDTGVAIVIVTHARKSPGEVDAIEKVSGTFGLSGAADTILILDRGSNGATLYGRGRDIEEIETAVEFDKGTCRWRVLGEAAEVHRSDERKAIRDALLDAAPMSPREIADLTGLSYDAVRQMLVRMVKADEVTRTKRGRYVWCSTPCHSGHNVTTDDEELDDAEELAP
jgi:AAA domain